MKYRQTHLRLADLVHQGALWPLAPAAIAMAALSAVRNGCFNRGLLASKRVPARVMSVGNLIAGGSGKTPLIAWLLEQTRALGYQPAVIARGYGSADGTQANDEAKMLDGPVFCHPQRYLAAQQAIAAGANCLLMDDGFQHRRLARDIDLICLDATRPWGWSHSRRGAFLPYGLLREGPRSLRRAQGMVATRCDQASPAGIAHIRGLAKGLGLPLWQTSHGPSGLRRISLAEPDQQTPAGTDSGPLTAIAGQRYWLVSAIARPQAFAHTMHSLGAKIVGQTRFPDHHHYSSTELKALLCKAQQMQAQLVCTAKDAVKLRDCLTPSQLSGGVQVLDIALQFLNDDEMNLQDWLSKRLRGIAMPQGG